MFFSIACLAATAFCVYRLRELETLAAQREAYFRQQINAIRARVDLLGSRSESQEKMIHGDFDKIPLPETVTNPSKSFLERLPYGLLKRVSDLETKGVNRVF
jgi:hypothetical protein